MLNASTPDEATTSSELEARTEIRRVAHGARLLIGVGVLLYAVGLIVGFALVGRHGNGAIQGLDNAAGRWFLTHRAPFVPVSRFIATYLDALPLGVGCFVVSVALGMRFRATWALVPFVSYLGGEGLVTAIRLVIHRARPLTAVYPAAGSISGMHETSYSFPSGHAVAVTSVLFAMFGVLAMTKKTWWPWIIAALLSLLVGYSRLVLGVHWLSDVVIGVAIGAIWGITVAAVARTVAFGDLRAAIRRGTASLRR